MIQAGGLFLTICSKTKWSWKICRATCDWLGKELQSHDIDAAAYHAGKETHQRNKVQSEWSSGAISVVVATIAFGMGIDRADVR